MVEKLIVKSIGTGKNRAKLVVFPGHEFSAEHFLPENFQRDIFLGSCVRVRVVRSRLVKGVSFISRTKRSDFVNVGGFGPHALDPISEARLARFLRQKQLWGAKVEEPLAAIIKPNGQQEVFYRFIKVALGNEWRIKHVKQYKSFLAVLAKHGISVSHHETARNSLVGEDGNLHFFDLEFTKVSPTAAKKLKLKRYRLPRE